MNDKVSRSIPGVWSIPGLLRASLIARCESSRERPRHRVDDEIAEFAPTLPPPITAGRHPQHGVRERHVKRAASTVLSRRLSISMLASMPPERTRISGPLPSFGPAGWREWRTPRSFCVLPGLRSELR
jgi:hypothetical protein